MKTEKKTIQKGIRFTESDCEKIKKAAEDANRTEADFMRLAILEYIKIIENMKK